MGKKSKHKKEKREKDRDPDLVELKNIIDQICEIIGCSDIKVRVRSDHVTLRFILSDVGSETDDVGLLLLDYESSDLRIRFASPNTKQKTSLAIGRKIVLNYLRTHQVLANITVDEVDTLNYFSISSQNTQGVLYDLIGYFNQSPKYHYLRLCSVCCEKQGVLSKKLIKGARGTLDLYSPLCHDCRIATGGRPTTDVVTDAYGKDPNIVKLLLLLSLEALTSTDRFTPFPAIRVNGTLKNTYAEVVNEFSQVPKDMDYWITHLNSVDTDSDLFDCLSGREYEFLKFVIESNNTLLSYFDHQFGSKNNSADRVIRETDVWEKSDLIVFNVTHDAELEDRFNKVENSTYLYHGSPAYNWHSILRNGLKNYSGTTKQSHGAAYGQGIYLAGNSATSMGYSRIGSLKFSVIAIAQVIDASKYNKRNSGIYVVPDEQKVLIKYLILNKGRQNRATLDQIFKYLTKDLPATLDHNRGCMTSITDRRLRGEYTDLRRRLEDLADTFDVQIELEEEVHEIKLQTPTESNGSKTEDTNEGEDNNRETKMIMIKSPDEPTLSLKSRTWVIKIDSHHYDMTSLTIIVDISYQYPLVPPKIVMKIHDNNSVTSLNDIPLLIKEESTHVNSEHVNSESVNRESVNRESVNRESVNCEYTYCEPALNHLTWKPGTKLWTVLAFLVESIVQ